MPDGLILALSLDGLGWIVAVTLLAGVVYGFAGFGAALILMPVASIFVPPVVLVPAFQVSAVISLVTLFPRALRKADPSTTAVLVVASLLAAPLGIGLLASLPEDAVRWAVSVTVAITLAALLLGWRYTTPPGLGATAAVGAAAGALGGATALNGPIAILFRLGGQDSADRTRANMLVFLTLNSILVTPIMALQGVMTWTAFWLGMVLLVPYGAGTLIGQALFRPDREGIYRTMAYGLIGFAAVLGLPIW